MTHNDKNVCDYDHDVIGRNSRCRKDGILRPDLVGTQDDRIRCFVRTQDDRIRCFIGTQDYRLGYLVGTQDYRMGLMIILGLAMTK